MNLTWHGIVDTNKQLIAFQKKSFRWRKRNWWLLQENAEYISSVYWVPMVGNDFRTHHHRGIYCPFFLSSCCLPLLIWDFTQSGSFINQAWGKTTRRDAHRRMSFKAHQMSWSGSQAAVMLFKPDVHWKMKTRVTLPVTNTQNRIPFEHAVNTIEHFGLEVNRIVVQSQHTHTHTRAPI